MKNPKIHLRDPHVPAAPLCCVNTRLQLTEKPDEVTCGNCLRMMERERQLRERREHERKEG